MWDLSARHIFSAPRLKILMPGAKSRRQPSTFALPSEKIDSLISKAEGWGKGLLRGAKNLFSLLG